MNVPDRIASLHRILLALLIVCAQWPLAAIATPPLSGPLSATALTTSTNGIPATPPRITNGPLACLILPDKIADLGSPVIGVIESIEVDRGDVVKQGQIVARLDSDVEQANASVLRSKAEAEGDLRAALANEAIAGQQVERGKRLVLKNYISDQDLDRLQSDYVSAQQKVTQAREQLKTSTRELNQALAQLAQRIVKSPIDGVVVERYANPGERVEEKPILKIASVDPLRVEVVAPVDMFGKLKLQQSAMVYPSLSGMPPREARITQIDHIVDPASNTFRIRLSLPNSDGSLAAGLRCKIDLRDQAATPNSTQPAIPPNSQQTQKQNSHPELSQTVIQSNEFNDDILHSGELETRPSLAAAR